MIEIQSRREGILLSVRAQPGSRRNEVKGEQDGALKLAITQIAEKGKANRVLVAFLADVLGLKKSQITLFAGETSSRKQFLITGLKEEELRTLLNDLLQSTER